MSKGLVAFFIIALGLVLYVWLVEMPAEQMRIQTETKSKRLVDFKEGDVQGLALRSQEADLELERAGEPHRSEWMITKPRKMEADPKAVDEFLRTLVLAKVSRVVDEAGSDLAAYGLAKPSMSVSVRLTSGTETVLFGDAGPLSSSIYAKREGDSKVVLTSMSGRELLTKGVQDFRRKRVMEFDPNRVTQLKVTTAQDTVVLHKEGHGDKATWKIKAPIETTADQPEVRSLMFGLEDLKAQSFLEDPKERQAKAAELKHPLVTITLYEQGEDAAKGDTDRTVTLFSNATNPTTAYAETTGEEPLYVVSAALAKDLAKDLFRLRNKELVAAEPERVKTLVLKKDHEEYSLTHEGTDWLVDGDPKAKADPARINMFVSRAVRLQAERIVTDKPKDLKPYGLDAPVAEITAADAQGKLLGRIAIGRQAENLAYAVGSAMPGVFQIRPDILREIPKKSELLGTGPPIPPTKDGAR